MCHRQLWKKTSFSNTAVSNTICLVCSPNSGYSSSNDSPTTPADAKESLTVALLAVAKQMSHYRDFDTTDEDDGGGVDVDDAETATTPDDQVSPRDYATSSASASSSTASCAQILSRELLQCK